MSDGTTRLAHAVVAVILLSHVCVAVFGNTIYVNPFGSDTNPGTKESPVKTIKHAANVTTDLGTIILTEGLYSGTDNTNVIIYDRTVKGENLPIINGATSTAIFQIQGKVTVSGIQFLGARNSIQIYTSVIKTNTPNEFYFSENSFVTPSDAGLKLYRGGSSSKFTAATTASVDKCLFTGKNNGYGVTMEYTKNAGSVTVSDCVVDNFAVGLDIETNFTVKSTVVSNCRMTGAKVVQKSSYSPITFTMSESSITACTTGLYAYKTHEVAVTSSKFDSCTSHAFHVSYAPSVTVSSATFTNNTCNETQFGGAGMLIYQESGLSCNKCVFSENSATQSGGAVDVRYDSSAAFLSSTFEYSSAGKTGGSIYVDRGTVLLRDSSISHSKAAAGGDAYACKGASQVIVRNSNITGSTDCGSTTE